MDKIYSRYRIRFPKIKFNNKINKKKNKRKILIIVVLIIAILTVKIVLDAVLPIFDTLCENKAKSIATIVSNEEASNVVKKYKYDDFFEMEKDAAGNIIMIKSNVSNINSIISEIPIKVQQNIDKKGKDNIQIALGSFFGIKLLSGRGPGIKITISSVGNVETDLKSEFISKGINQTLHRVYLDVKCNIIILTPFYNIEKEITNQVLLMENIIVGNIPNTYLNLKE